MSPSYEFAYAMEEIGMAIIPGLLSGIPSGAFSIASYILTALALYALAKRRAIDHAWLAWVPLANCWLLGSLSDQYRYVVKGEIKSKRKILLMLKAVSVALTVSIIALAVAVVVQGARGTMYGMRGDEIFESQLGTLLGILGISLPLAGVSIAFAVFYFMALYDIYTSCDPDNNVLFTVLSILFGVTKPFFLFFSRNKDSGMPPRREEIPWETPPEKQFPLDPDVPLSALDEMEFL